MEITIKGQCPPKKNARQLFVRNGRIVNVPSQRHKAWEQSALQQLKSAFQGQADGKVSAAYHFYVKDNRKRDLDNMIASVNDVLVKAGLLSDDSWQCLSIGGAEAEVDSKDPRVVVWLYEE